MLRSRLAGSDSPGLSFDKLQGDKKLAEDRLTETIESRTTLESLIRQEERAASCHGSPPQPIRGLHDLAALSRRYFSLHERLSEARTAANHWSRKKVSSVCVSVCLICV